MTAAARPDLAVVGAGPAGLAAALAAASFGCSVALIDAGPAIGGQIYRQSMLGPASADSGRLPPRLRRAARHRRIRHLAATSVWHAERDPAAGEGGRFLLRLSGPDARVRWPEEDEREPNWPGRIPDAHGQTADAHGQTADAHGQTPDARGRAADGPAGQAGQTVLRARSVVVATGATELVLPFPGWDLPGVTTAGAAQALLKSQGVTVGGRVIVSGSGPLLLPVAAGLAEAGVQVVAVLEATAARAGARYAARFAAYPGKLREAAGYAAALARHRVPVRTGHAVVACRGAGRVERATIARLDRDWRPVPGSQREETVDALHVSFGFSPALELARLLGCADAQHPARPTAAVTHDADLATSVAGVFAAGEVTGIGGAQVAELEGYVAGASAARYLGRLHPAAYTARTRTIRARLGPARRFAALLDDAYPLRPGWLDWPGPGTITCRCEDTAWAQIGRAVAAGAIDVRSVKGLTRCGMGYCQGRVCGPAVQYAVAAAAGRPLADVGDLHSRPVLTPVPLGLVADAD
jgi:D-hydroxyproline dehydrogenase subunit alpha